MSCYRLKNIDLLKKNTIVLDEGDNRGIHVDVEDL